MLGHFIGQKDIIKSASPRAEFYYTFQPQGFEIPFKYYSLEEWAERDLAVLIEEQKLTIRDVSCIPDIDVSLHPVPACTWGISQM